MGPAAAPAAAAVGETSPSIPTLGPYGEPSTVRFMKRPPCTGRTCWCTRATAMNAMVATSEEYARRHHPALSRGVLGPLPSDSAESEKARSSTSLSSLRPRRT